ncbi:MAG: hypothetical protein ABR908_05110 [Terriglobales bacterium]
MSTAAVSSQSIYQELQSFYQNRNADLSQLGSALKSGDLNGAQQAYSTLASLGQNGPFANSEPFSKSSRAQAFETIGQDLQSGDLAGAQAAFATLTNKQSPSTTAAESNPATVVNINITEPSSGAPTTAATPTAAGTTTTTGTSSIYQQLQAYRQQRLSDLQQLGQDLATGNQTAAQQDFNTLTTLGQSGPNANGQVFQSAARTQDFQAIGTALQSGNLSAAQSAFTTLAGTFNKNVQAELAISGYGTTGAQPVGPTPAPVSVTPPPVARPVGPTPAPVSATPLQPVAQPVGPTSVGPTTAGTSSFPEIIINLGGASGSGASSGSATTPEIVINLGQENNSSSASPEEITINLGSGSSGDTIAIDTTQGNSSQQININLNQQSNDQLIVNLLNANAISQTESNSGSALSVTA